MFASHPRLAVISQYISIRQHIQRPLYIWLPTIPHEISTLFHLILAILLWVFTCVFFACIILAMCPTCPHFRTKKKHAKLLFRLLFSLPCQANVTFLDYFLYVFSLILRFHPQTPKETPKTLRGCDDTTGTGGCRWDFPGMIRETAKPTGVNIVI